MTEIHGWVTIRDTFKVTDDDNTREIADRLLQELETIQYLPTIEMKWMDGECYLQVSLYTNHWSSDCAATLEMYHMIAEKAEGSYGVLYVHDDEDKEFGNEFRIYRLARGKVEVFRDTLLSPCIPMIEDEWLG